MQDDEFISLLKPRDEILVLQNGVAYMFDYKLIFYLYATCKMKHFQTILHKFRNCKPLSRNLFQNFHVAIATVVNEPFIRFCSWKLAPLAYSIEGKDESYGQHPQGLDIVP